jgi:beta-lactamase class A
MSGMFASLFSNFRRRPVSWAAGVLLVGTAAFGGGAMVGKLTSHEQVQLTSKRAPPPVEVAPPPAPAELQARLETLAKRFREPVGVAVTDVTERWTAEVDGEALYPQQSVSKLWVALATMQAVDEGKLTLDQTVTMTKDDRSVFYQPITGRLRRGPFDMTVADLLHWAITESDNSANDKLIQTVGGPEVVVRMMRAKGLADVRAGDYERVIQTRTAGLTWQPDYGVTWIFKQARAALPDAVRDQAEEAYLADPGDGAAPAGITRALARLQRGELLSPGSTQVMLDLLHETRTGPMRLKAGLSRGWTIGHKTGTGPDWRFGSVGINDVGLITAPDGHTYAVAVMMRRTRAPLSARQRFMQAVSQAVVEHWKTAAPLPAEGRRVAAAAGTVENGL